MSTPRPPRMTLPTQLVLRAMLDEPGLERYGLEIGETAGLPSGTIHPILARLERLGWLGSRWGGVDPPPARRPPPPHHPPPTECVEHGPQGPAPPPPPPPSRGGAGAGPGGPGPAPPAPARPGSDGPCPARHDHRQPCPRRTTPGRVRARRGAVGDHAAAPVRARALPLRARGRPPLPRPP